MPERKAIYLSILDAALNGSFYITTDDAIEIFGISENYVERTRNITQEIGKKNKGVIEYETTRSSFSTVE